MKDTYYMKHDANAGRDERILDMRAEWGSEGYGLYWLINEYLREQSNVKAHLSKLAALAFALNETVEKVERFVNDGIEKYGLYISDGEFFWSERMKRDKEELDQLREINRQNGIKSGKARAKEQPKEENKQTNERPLNDRSATVERPLNETGTIDEQGKERKVIKEKKEEGIVKGGNPPKTPKRPYGPFKNVRLTDEEYKKYQDLHGDPRLKMAIEKLSAYKESKGKRYKSDFATMRVWVFDSVAEDLQKNPGLLDKYRRKPREQPKIPKITTCESCGGEVFTMDGEAKCRECGAFYELKNNKWERVE